MNKIIIGIVAIAAIALGVSAINTSTKESKDQVQIVRNEVQDQVAYEVSSALAAGTYRVQPEKTVVNWEGGNVLKSHYGTIEVTPTDIAIESDQSVSGVISLDMNTLISEAGGSLDGHLKNEDFFDVAKYPTASFEIKEYTDGTISGDLTIKDVTKEFSTPALVSVQDGEMTLSSDFSFDRTEFGIVYNSAGFFQDLGDSVIDDTIDISLVVVAETE